MTDQTDHSYRRPDLSIAATRLHAEFDGTFGTETIERFLHSSYDQFAARSTVSNFLPLLAERFARQRLHALAKVEGHTAGKPTVLFLSVHNAGRSQMALGFFQHLAGDRAVAWSGGSEPGHEIIPSAVAAMADRGIDISREFPKPWTDEIVRAADVVITMGCGDACPVVPGKRYLDWQLDDPAAGKGVEDVRPVRDDIERRVRGLLEELGVPATRTRRIPLPRKILAEFLGSLLLAALVIGSGIAAQNLSDDIGLRLLENAAATAAGLYVLILVFGPVSGAHFQPGRHRGRRDPRRHILARRGRLPPRAGRRMRCGRRARQRDVRPRTHQHQRHPSCHCRARAVRSCHRFTGCDHEGIANLTAGSSTTSVTCEPAALARTNDVDERRPRSATRWSQNSAVIKRSKM
jgi:arsenate reductase